MLDPTNSKDVALKLTTTVVYFTAGSDAYAADVANAIGKGPAQPVATPLPVTEVSFAGGNVLIMLGTDLAGKTIPGGAVAGAGTPAVTAAASPNTTATAKPTTTVKKTATTAKKK